MGFTLPADLACRHSSPASARRPGRPRKGSGERNHHSHESGEPDEFTTAGTLITYTYVVTNSAASLTSVENIQVTDSNPAVKVTCVSTQLAIGASTDCTGTYTTTAANVGSNIVNTAQASVDNTIGCGGDCGSITSNVATA